MHTSHILFVFVCWPCVHKLFVILCNKQVTCCLGDTNYKKKIVPTSHFVLLFFFDKTTKVLKLQSKKLIKTYFILLSNKRYLKVVVSDVDLVCSRLFLNGLCGFRGLCRIDWTQVKLFFSICFAHLRKYDVFFYSTVIFFFFFYKPPDCAENQKKSHLSAQKHKHDAKCPVNLS